ncbi:hypothetical protein JTE90_013383 [Oedothorax gibbosus]|uniref:Uncharacterized protein n=1 Tax=Oedothorax gibbosus TaxID=931172 RepID=A0AAV6TW16_9ARAC|nr:hypothetical protein JTE90_013383 [Oedothorax gibbosus]
MASKKCQSYIIASDDMVHGKYAVWTFLIVITESLKSQYPGIQKVHIFSDGSSAQFKNKYNLMNLSYFKSDFGLDCIWSFFATSHGKGAVDGIGGKVKRAVATAVLTRKWTVRNAEEFVVCARSVTKAISVIFIPKSDIENCVNSLDERWESVNAIPYTMLSMYQESMVF